MMMMMIMMIMMMMIDVVDDDGSFNRSIGYRLLSASARHFIQCRKTLC